MHYQPFHWWSLPRPFSGQLDKAKEATDKANERAAKAAATAEYLTSGTTGARYYNAETGKLVANRTQAGTAYGKQDSAPNNNKNKWIKVTVTAAGDVATAWVAN